MISDVEFRRLIWHSRRGMLELDVLLGPFTQLHFKTLDDSDQAHYLRLIEGEDADIWGWLQGTLAPADADIGRIVAMINEKVGAGLVR